MYEKTHTINMTFCHNHIAVYFTLIDFIDHLHWDITTLIVIHSHYCIILFSSSLKSYQNLGALRMLIYTHRLGQIFCSKFEVKHVQSCHNIHVERQYPVHNIPYWTALHCVHFFHSFRWSEQTLQTSMDGSLPWLFTTTSKDALNREFTTHGHWVVLIWIYFASTMYTWVLEIPKRP